MRKQNTDNYEEALKQIRLLSPDDHRTRAVFTVLMSTVSQNTLYPKTGSLRSITELEGLGKEVWAGIDVEKYIDEERNSWD